MGLFFKKYFFHVYLFWEREAEHKQGRGRQSGRERIPSGLHGARTHEPWDHDLSQNQESDTSLTEPPRHPFNGILNISFGGSIPPQETRTFRPTGSKFVGTRSTNSSSGSNGNWGHFLILPADCQTHMFYLIWLHKNPTLTGYHLQAGISAVPLRGWFNTLLGQQPLDDAVCGRTSGSYSFVPMDTHPKHHYAVFHAVKSDTLGALG